MIRFYSYIMGKSEFLLRGLLKKRLKKGKEDAARLPERMGEPSLKRPEGTVVWFHAASVGEAQSTLILVSHLLQENKDLSVLVTTGTVTSAQLMADRLPKRAVHQYYPLDHPQWVASFLDHWKPDVALWMESEIWPNMFAAIGARNIPAALINARLSEKSLKRWQKARKGIEDLLSIFSVCLTQTEEDAESFRALGMRNVLVSGNLKYSADLLPVDEMEFTRLKDSIGKRPIWLMASTHDPEEEIGCRLHRHLKKEHPELLTIIVPRHPERRDRIMTACEKYGLKIKQRSTSRHLPEPDTDIYIADTIGELGLFYKLAPIAYIGRSMSSDGGGGHNPIEAAQYYCAVLHGQHIQNLQAIFDAFDEAGAAIKLKDETDFQKRLGKLMADDDGLDALQHKAGHFVKNKATVLPFILEEIEALLPKADQIKECA
ncbi:MAG: 3-deoxy-D-manno-octulosonic acid transferase [Pseudomonadota bacterium]|nr:3-deoxy-D-manno-octulosonic acid transferase [Pseudomonadota bacterium]